MKKNSASLAIMEMQIKTTLIFYLSPVRMAIIKKTNYKQCGWEWGEKNILIQNW
jgi:hypothetical protein